MDRQELIDWVKRGPVSDGSTHVIPSLEWCLITPVSAHVLYRAEDGKLRTHYLSLVCMARVEQLETSEIL